MEIDLYARFEGVSQTPYCLHHALEKSRAGDEIHIVVVDSCIPSGRSECRACDEQEEKDHQNKNRKEIIRKAYIELLSIKDWKDRFKMGGQHLLTSLLDIVAHDEGKSREEIQNECEEKARQK